MPDWEYIIASIAIPRECCPFIKNAYFCSAVGQQPAGYIKTLETTASDLQKQINDANAEIAKVESELWAEITTLEQSLLYELNAAKSAIEAEMSAIKLTLAELKAADTALDKKIADLRTYVDTNSLLQRTGQTQHSPH